MSSDEVLEYIKLFLTKVLLRDIIICYLIYIYFEFVPKPMSSLPLNKIFVLFVADYIIFI
jgi:hypothetical protein